MTSVMASVVTTFGEGMNQHVVKPPRRPADVELGRDRVERLTDLERTIAPPAYQVRERFLDGADVARLRDGTSEASEQARRRSGLGRHAKNRFVKRQIVDQLARQKRARTARWRVD